MYVARNYPSVSPRVGGGRTAPPPSGADFLSSVADLKKQLADPENSFYKETHLAMRQTVKENDERRKEDAVIDALTAILDNMARNSRIEAGQQVERAGVKLGLQEDEPEGLEAGSPWDPMKTAEMQAFAAVLADQGAFRLTEGETEAEQVRERGEERRELTNEEIAELAQRYDPHDMSQEEYRDFLDGLARMGALSREDLEHIQMKDLLGLEGSGLFMSRTAPAVSDGGDAFGISYGWLCTAVPLDRDAMGWLGERMEWTVGDWNDPQYAVRDREALSALSGIFQRMLTAEKPAI